MRLSMSLVDLVAGSVVRVGSGNKAAVLAIQTALGITADGDFGDGTEAAVEAFQRAHDLTDDGAVGHMTATAIDAVAAAPAQATIQVVSALNDEPNWNRLARTQIGIHEVGDNSGPDVERYIEGAHAGAAGGLAASISRDMRHSRGCGRLIP
jgi:peptidoglycan hydrolase-like protein with peptidoglycan-binding domain